MLVVLCYVFLEPPKATVRECAEAHNRTDNAANSKNKRILAGHARSVR